MRPLFSLSLLALTSAGWAQTSAQPASGENPAVTVETIDAERLAAEIEARRGRIVVLNVWATWCSPCVAEYPHLVEFARGADPEKVQIIGLSGDFLTDIESKVLPFLAEQRPPFPNFVIDEHDDIFIPAVDPEWGGAFPHTVIFGPDGEIGARLGEFHGPDEIREAVDRVAGRTEG